MGIFRTAISTSSLYNFGKFTTQSLMKNQNKFWSQHKYFSILPTIQSNPLNELIPTIQNQTNNYRFYSNYKSNDSSGNYYDNINIKKADEKKLDEKNNVNFEKKADETKKSAKVLPIVLHQVTGQSDKSVAVPYEQQIPQWTETDTVSETTKAMEEFTQNFLDSQKLLETTENNNENIKISEIDNEIDNEIEEKSYNNPVIDIIGDKCDINNNNVMSFRFDAEEFNHLPISAMNLKFDMELPDLADALQKTKDNEDNIIPLGFNAKINGTVDLNDGEKLESLEFEEISHIVSSLAANICAVALQKVLIEKNKEVQNAEKSDDVDEDV